MVTSYAGENCPMVQLYCSEQITIPQSFPNILKTFAKAAIRTQPYDILRWSAAYFRCLACNAPPPAKIRLERECRRGSLTKGYLKVLVTQVGKGFFISRCLLQERWKALCLREDDLLKYLSLCRMLNWPQVHWLKLFAVMIGSLNATPQDTMTMVCELLTDDVDGGLARIPYWMFKICYTFVAQLECSQEQCFVNGQLVLPWGDLEDVTPMERLPRVLSATLLKDTIITSCKAKFDKPYYRECNCPEDISSRTMSTDYTNNTHLDDPKELLAKCEDFDSIILILQNAQRKPLTEDDFNDEHYIFEKQLKDTQEVEDKTHERDKSEQTTQEQMDASQMLSEVGPPWTWLHEFTINHWDTASYNFIHQESELSDANPIMTSAEIFDLVKQELSPEVQIEENRSLEGLKTLIEEAVKESKCELEEISSIIVFLQSKDISEGLEPSLDLNEIVRCLERAEVYGKTFSNVDDLIEHIEAQEAGEAQRKLSASIDDINMISKDEGEDTGPMEDKPESTEKVQQSPERVEEEEIVLDPTDKGGDDEKPHCCENPPTPKPDIEPPQQFHYSIRSKPGIGAAVSQKTIDDFLAFLRARSRSQRGLISPRNFKEERCPNMVDVKLD